MSLTLLHRLRPSRRGFGADLRGAAAMSIVTAAVLLGAATGAATAAAGPGDVTPATPGPAPTDGKLLPDVNTMIERLKSRLEAKPSDMMGWQMLGWSYFYTAHFKEAADAYAKALELNPESAELKGAYEEAKAKASGIDTSEKAAALPMSTGHGGDGHGMGAHGSGVETMAKSEGMPESQVRAMVDGLASRLESSPRDVEGWAMLMRSRVVLGEKEGATTVFRKALEIFKDDSVASGRITALAVELGLKTE